MPGSASTGIPEKNASNAASPPGRGTGGRDGWGDRDAPYMVLRLCDENARFVDGLSLGQA